MAGIAMLVSKLIAEVVTSRVPWLIWVMPVNELVPVRMSVPEPVLRIEADSDPIPTMSSLIVMVSPAH
jgi:hypothetical protein